MGKGTAARTAEAYLFSFLLRPFADVFRVGFNQPLAYCSNRIYGDVHFTNRLD